MGYQGVITSVDLLSAVNESMPNSMARRLTQAAVNDSIIINYEVAYLARSIDEATYLYKNMTHSLNISISTNDFTLELQNQAMNMNVSVLQNAFSSHFDSTLVVADDDDNNNNDDKDKEGGEEEDSIIGNIRLAIIISSIIGALLVGFTIYYFCRGGRSSPNKYRNMNKSLMKAVEDDEEDDVL